MLFLHPADGSEAKENHTRIRKLEDLNPDDFKRIMTGYTTTRKCTVKKTESAEETTISMKLATLTEP